MHYSKFFALIALVAIPRGPGYGWKIAVIPYSDYQCREGAQSTDLIEEGQCKVYPQEFGTFESDSHRTRGSFGDARKYGVSPP